MPILYASDFGLFVMLLTLEQSIASEVCLLLEATKGADGHFLMSSDYSFYNLIIYFFQMYVMWSTCIPLVIYW